MRIKLIIFDGDGTLWHYPVGDFGSSWCALSRALGVQEENEKLLQFYYDKFYLDREWAVKLSALYTKGSVELAREKLYPIPYSRGVRDFFEKRKESLRAGLLTTAIDFIAEKASEELGLDFCFCNILHTKNGYFTGSLEYKVPLWGKQVILESILRKISPEKTIYVGDTKNDVLCMEMADLAIAFNPKDNEVRNAADFVINDFRELEGMLK